LATTNGERLKAHKAKMRAAGFRRLSIWVHPDLVAELARRRGPGECGGRTLERLLLGEARQRPGYWERVERRGY
jgi:hypothetical protein